MEPKEDNKKSSQPETGLKLHDLSLFHNDSHSVFLYKKVQSLLSALYMVTDFFPAEEPLKWNIRSKSVDLLGNVMALTRETFSERKNLLILVMGEVLEIVSLCEVASQSLLISVMNFKILRRELENLIMVIEKREESYRINRNFLLDENLFNVPEPEAKPSPVVISRSHFKGQSSSISSEPKVKGQNNLKDKNDRRNSIFSLLKTRSDLSIKDISESIKDCSEKTIQRELSKMVEEGLIKKVGERRWSKYSLTIL